MKIEATGSEDLQIHLICDNYGTHEPTIIKTWLASRPRVHLHHPTYSSWLNLVERFFGCVTVDLFQRPDHRSVQALEADVRKWGRRLERKSQAVRVDQDRRPDPRQTWKTFKRTSNSGHLQGRSNHVLPLPPGARRRHSPSRGPPGRPSATLRAGRASPRGTPSATGSRRELGQS